MKMDLSPDEVKIALEDYLGYSIFQRIWGVFRQILSQLWRDLTEWFTRLTEENPALSIAIVIGLCVILGLLIWHIVATIRGVLRESASLQEDEAVTVVIAPSLQRWQSAIELARAGEHTDATRQLFLALAFHLEESGAAKFKRSDTNREYLARVASGAPTAVGAVQLLTRLIDDKWFALARVEAVEFDEARAAVEKVMAA